MTWFAASVPPDANRQDRKVLAIMNVRGVDVVVFAFWCEGKWRSLDDQAGTISKWADLPDDFRHAPMHPVSAVAFELGMAPTLVQEVLDTYLRHGSLRKEVGNARQS